MIPQQWLFVHHGFLCTKFIGEGIKNVLKEVEGCGDIELVYLPHPSGVSHWRGTGMPINQSALEMVIEILKSEEAVMSIDEETTGPAGESLEKDLYLIISPEQIWTR